MMNRYSVTQLASTVADALGCERPLQASEPLPLVRNYLDQTLGGKADRVLVYNPDCMGQWFWQKYTDKYIPVMKAAPLAVPLSTVMPSVTPVCFGSMYTGAMPAVHGIRTYAKPVITIDSLFDSAARSGKKAALVAVQDSSMARIFMNRPIDYYIEKYDGEVTERAMSLIEEDRYDLLVVYNQEYDDLIHETEIESPEALAAAFRHIDTFEKLTDAVRENWKDHSVMTVFAPDHGNHMDWNGHGNHGEFREDDINIIHFYGAYPKAR